MFNWWRNRSKDTERSNVPREDIQNFSDVREKMEMERRELRENMEMQRRELRLQSELSDIWKAKTNRDNEEMRNLLDHNKQIMRDIAESIGFQDKLPKF